MPSATIATRAFRSGTSELQRHGLVAAVVPVAEGGGGASLASTRRIVSAVARGEPSTALVLTMTYLTHRGISRPDSRWSPRLRDALYRSAVTDGALANSLRVEPALGSPARGGLPDTVARRVGDGWRLSGHKLYTTGIPALRWLAVWARTDEPDPRVGVFLVPREAHGIRVIESWDHLGLRASGSHEVVFDQVELPLDHAVDMRPAVEWGAAPDADQYAWMIVLLGALYDGIARAAHAWLLRFLSERAPGSLGAPRPPVCGAVSCTPSSACSTSDPRSRSFSTEAGACWPIWCNATTGCHRRSRGPTRSTTSNIRCTAIRRAASRSSASSGGRGRPRRSTTTRCGG